VAGGHDWSGCIGVKQAMPPIDAPVVPATELVAGPLPPGPLTVPLLPLLPLVLPWPPLPPLGSPTTLPPHAATSARVPSAPSNRTRSPCRNEVTKSMIATPPIDARVPPWAIDFPGEMRFSRGAARGGPGRAREVTIRPAWAFDPRLFAPRDPRRPTPP